jgi:hypothetical protein
MSSPNVRLPVTPVVEPGARPSRLTRMRLSATATSVLALGLVGCAALVGCASSNTLATSGSNPASSSAIAGGGPAVPRSPLLVTPPPATSPPTSPAAEHLRLTVAGGCSARDSGDTGVTNSGADLATSLLPAGTPTAGLICRYAGLNGHQFLLTSSQELDAADAAKLAAAVGHVQTGQPGGAPMNCPMADGSASVLALTYPGRPDVDLWWATTGCQTVSNGQLSANLGGALVGFAPSSTLPMPLMRQSPPAS